MKERRNEKALGGRKSKREMGGWDVEKARRRARDGKARRNYEGSKQIKR